MARGKKRRAASSGSTGPARQPDAARAEAPPSSARRSSILIGGALVLAVLGAFGRTLHHDFVNLDDGPYVLDNPWVNTGLNWRGIAWAFTHSASANWHPLTWISHMLDCQWFGVASAGHHLISVLLHAAVAVVLFSCLRQMTGALWRSAFAAALFAVHPLRAESVAWVAERKDVLSGLFFVLTLWAYVGYAQRRFSLGRYLGVLALFACGLMAKQMLVTLPLVLLLVDYWPLGRFDRAEPGRKALVLEKIPALVLALIASWVVLRVQKDATVHLDAMPVGQRVVNALLSYVSYLGDFFWPTRLAAYYPYPKHAPPNWETAAALVLLATITVAAWKLRSQRPYLLVGWLWYLGMLVPVIGLVQVGNQRMADRYTYLPEIGLAVALTWLIADLAAGKRHARPLLSAGAAVVLALLLPATIHAAGAWKDSETLWERALANTTDNAFAHNNLGTVLARDGRLAQAVLHFEEALRFEPDNYLAHNNLGVALMTQNRLAEAIVHYQKAIALRPDYGDAEANLGSALAGRGQFPEALSHLGRAVELGVEGEDVHVKLGLVLAQLGRNAEATEQFKKALAIHPGDARVQGYLTAVSTSAKPAGGE
jgi:Flp pilus assembly protein TadD